MNKIKVIATYLLFYFVFICGIFFTRLPVQNEVVATFIPDIATILVFIFSSVKNKNILSYGNIFILGIIFDILNLSAVGMTSICWMTGIKIISGLSSYFFNNDNFFAYLRNFFIFIVIDQLLRVFLTYLLFAVVYNLFDIALFIIVNTIWFVVIFLLSNKLKLNEVN